MNKLATAIRSEAQKRTPEEDFLSVLHFGLSASPQIFYPNARIETNELNEDEARFLLSQGCVKAAINPRHTLSVAKIRQLGLPVEIPAVKPYTRIGPGGSILVMQPVGAGPALLDGFFNERDVKNLKVMFRWIRVVGEIDRLSFLQEPPFN
jgi:hypothetical protein